MYYLKPLDADKDDNFLPPWPENYDPSAGVAAPAPPTDADAVDDLPTPHDEDEAINKTMMNMKHIKMQAQTMKVFLTLVRERVSQFWNHQHQELKNREEHQRCRSL
eukprot:9374081-Ditylum_brightwellii.AAC.1